MSEIKILIKNILSFYQEKEIKNTISPNKYFWHNTEYTEFEKQVIVESKLQILDIFVIMELFKIVYNNNYNLFEDFDMIEELLESCDIIIPENDKKNLQSLKDPFCWIQYLSLYYFHSSMDENDEIEIDTSNITVGNLSFSKKTPPICEKKIFTIADIVSLIM